MPSLRLCLPYANFMTFALPGTKQKRSDLDGSERFAIEGYMLMLAEQLLFLSLFS